MVSPAEKCFLPSEAGFSGFLARRSRTNKCQHLCQMGEDGIFAPHSFPRETSKGGQGCSGATSPVWRTVTRCRLLRHLRR